MLKTVFRKESVTKMIFHETAVFFLDLQHTTYFILTNYYIYNHIIGLISSLLKII